MCHLFCILHFAQHVAPEPVTEPHKAAVPEEYKMLSAVFDRLVQTCQSKATNAVSTVCIYLHKTVLFSMYNNIAVIIFTILPTQVLITHKLYIFSKYLENPLFILEHFFVLV